MAAAAALTLYQYGSGHLTDAAISCSVQGVYMVIVFQWLTYANRDQLARCARRAEAWERQLFQCQDAADIHSGRDEVDRVLFYVRADAE